MESNGARGFIHNPTWHHNLKNTRTQHCTRIWSSGINEPHRGVRSWNIGGNRKVCRAGEEKVKEDGTQDPEEWRHQQQWKQTAARCESIMDEIMPIMEEKATKYAEGSPPAHQRIPKTRMGSSLTTIMNLISTPPSRRRCRSRIIRRVVKAVNSFKFVIVHIFFYCGPVLFIVIPFSLYLLLKFRLYIICNC